MTIRTDKIVLTIHHNIFLTREERYKIINRESTTVIGVSVPIWVLNKSGLSTEPGAEVFSLYEINNIAEKELTIRKGKNGYSINLPQTPKDYVPIPPLSIERWLEMTEDEKENWYMSQRKIKTATNLRDRTDGGAEYLRFEKQRKAKFRKGPYIHVAHWVEIKLIETLNNTMLH
jgi:poly(3-hydroxyalkanoate) synthetase